MGSALFFPCDTPEVGVGFADPPGRLDRPHSRVAFMNGEGE